MSVAGGAELGPADTITVALPAYPKNIFYYLADDEPSLAVNTLVFETLAARDWDTGALYPRLASRWKWSKDHRALTFTLNPAAKFSDGVAVTAADVVFTFEALRDPTHLTAPFRAVLSSFSGCRAIDSRTVVFQTPTADYRSLERIASLFILPKHVFAKIDFNRPALASLIGSGPYRLVSAIPAEQITLSLNPEYWGKTLEINRERYRIPNILFRTLPDYLAGPKWLNKGQLDFYYVPLAKIWAQDLAGPPYDKGYLRKMEVPSKLPFGTQAIYWNLRKAIFSDVRVRRALAHLFPREQVIQSLFFDQYLLATGIIHVGSRFHSPLNTPIEYERKRAEQLLRQAGWKRSDGGKMINAGKTLAFTIDSAMPSSERYLTIYQEELKQLGIEMQIRISEWSALLDRIDRREFDAVEMTRSRDLEPGDFAVDWGSAEAERAKSANFTGYRDELSDRWMKQIDRSFDGDRRQEIVRKFDERLSSLQPALFLWDARALRIVHQNRFEQPQPSGHPYARWFEMFHDWAIRPSPKAPKKP